MRVKDIKIKLGSEYSLTGNKKFVAKSDIMQELGSIIQASSYQGGATGSVRKIRLTNYLGVVHGKHCYDFENVDFVTNFKIK